MPLFLCKAGEVLDAGPVQITVLEVTGGSTTLDVRAPLDCPIRRAVTVTEGAREATQGVVASPSVGLAVAHKPHELLVEHDYPRDRGPGPWCERCGTTMGLRGGEYLCSFCDR